MDDLSITVESVTLETVALEANGDTTVSRVDVIQAVQYNGGDRLPEDSEGATEGNEVNLEGSDSGVELASAGRDRGPGSRGSSIASEELMTQSLTLTSRGRPVRQPTPRSVSNLERPPRSSPKTTSLKNTPPARDDGRWPSTVARVTRAKPAPNPKPASLTTPPRPRGTTPVCSERINRLAASKWATERPPSTSSSGSERADWLRSPRPTQRQPTSGRGASASRRPEPNRPGSAGSAGSGAERFWSLPRRPAARSASAGRSAPRTRRRDAGVQTPTPPACKGCSGRQRDRDELLAVQAAHTALSQELEAVSLRARDAENEAAETQEFQQAEMVTLSESLAAADQQRERLEVELQECQRLVALSEQNSQQSSLTAGAAVSGAAVALSALVARIDTALLEVPNGKDHGDPSGVLVNEPSIPASSPGLKSSIPRDSSHNDFTAQVAALDLRVTRLMQLANLSTAE